MLKLYKDWKGFGCKIFRTDLYGEIEIMVSEKGEIRIKKFIE